MRSIQPALGRALIVASAAGAVLVGAHDAEAQDFSFDACNQGRTDLLAAVAYDRGAS